MARAKGPKNRQVLKIENILPVQGKVKKKKKKNQAKIKEHKEEKEIGGVSLATNNYNKIAVASVMRFFAIAHIPSLAYALILIEMISPGNIKAT